MANEFWWGIGLGLVGGFLVFSATGRGITRAAGGAVSRGVGKVTEKAGTRVRRELEASYR